MYVIHLEFAYGSALRALASLFYDYLSASRC